SRSRPSDGIWYSLSKVMLMLIVLSAAIPFAYSFMPEVSKRREQRTRIEMLTGEVEKLRMTLARGEREENLLRNDPEYIAIIARDKLDLMKEGETIYRIDPPKIDPSSLRLKK
ncbi:MAG: septum formation initiator family protein, partial [Chthoniobacteraceae bacterium]